LFSQRLTPSKAKLALLAAILLMSLTILISLERLQDLSTFVAEWQVALLQHWCLIQKCEQCSQNFIIHGLLAKKEFAGEIFIVTV